MKIKSILIGVFALALFLSGCSPSNTESANQKMMMKKMHHKKMMMQKNKKRHHSKYRKNSK